MGDVIGSLLREVVVNAIAPYITAPAMLGILCVLAGLFLARSVRVQHKLWMPVVLAKRRWPTMVSVYIGMFALGGVIALTLTAYSHWQHEKLLNKNFITNGNFDGGDEGWGYGYLEDAVRNGNYPEEEPLLPYVVSPNPKKTVSRGEPSSDGYQSPGSYMFHHQTDPKDHHWGSLAQRVTGLERGRWYVVNFWAKAEGLDPGDFFLTTDLKWKNRSSPESVRTPVWMRGLR